MKIAALITGLVVCIIVGEIVCRKMEQPYRFYATANDAISAKERERGWFLNFIPNSATEIHIQNDIDNNDFWIRFNLPKEISDSLKLTLQRAAVGTIVFTKPYDASWWFEGLIEQQPANDNALYSDVFVTDNPLENHHTVIAFDKVSSVVYVWSFHP
jgi:hypothetical protein